MDNIERLKQVVHDIINDRTEEASATIHDVFVSKTREISGIETTSEDNGDSDSEYDRINESLSVDEILKKLQTATGGSAASVKAFWTGGSSAGLEAYTSKLEKLGMDTSGAWEENKKFFKGLGLSKAEYNKLSKASI